MTRLHRLATLAAIFAAGCAGEAGPAGSNGAEGTPGVPGSGGQPCSVTQNADGGATVTCPDGSTVTIAAPGGCTIRDNGDGTKTVSCEDGTGAVITDGVDATRTPGSVSGTIVDPLGRPVGGVTATLLGTPHTATSGPDGLFRLLTVSAGVHELELSHPLFGAQPAGLVVVDATETRLGAITLRGGALLAPGYVSAIDRLSRDGQRLLTRRAFHRGDGTSLFRSEVVDTQGGVVGGWLQESWMIAEWSGAELHGAVLAGWTDPNIGLCWLRWLDVATGASIELGTFDCWNANVIRDERLHLDHMEWGGVRGARVELDLDTGAETVLDDRLFWTSLASGDLYRARSTDELFFRPVGGGAELATGIFASQVQYVVNGAPADGFFWLVWNDGLGDPSLGRFDMQGAGLTIVAADLGRHSWGGLPFWEDGEGGVFYFGSRQGGPNGEVGDLLHAEGVQPPTPVCEGNAFGAFWSLAGQRLVVCQLLSPNPGEVGMVRTRRLSDGLEIEAHRMDEPYELFAFDADWLYRADTRQSPTSLELLSIADGSSRTLSANALLWTWGGLGSVMFVTEQLPDATLERAYYRPTDLRRTVVSMERNPLFADAAGDALFTTDAAGFERWNLATGASAWRSPQAGPWSWFGRPPSSAQLALLTPSPLHPELSTLSWLDLASGRRTATMDPIGAFRFSPDQRTLWVAEAPYPGIDAGRAPGLYALTLP